MKNTKNYTISARIITILIACAAFFLASCSSIDTMLAENTAQESAAAPVGTVEPEPGGEMFIAYPGDVESFDPLDARNEDLINLLSLIYETPLAVDASGKIGPNLVETWQTDESKTEFTFSIRKGVTFHDGQPLTAADVYGTIMDILKLDGTDKAGHIITSIDTSDGTSGTETGNTGANIGAPTYIEMWTTVGGGDGNGNGDNTSTTEEDSVSAVNRYTIYNGDIESVTLVDDYSIRLKMMNPGRAALYFMTFPVRPEGTVDFSLPVGSGPYKVDSAEEEIHLSVNEQWWKIAPYIQSIVAKPVTGYNEKLENYESGLLDLITTDSIAAGKLKAEGKTQTVDYLTNYYDCLIPNLFDESMKNDNIRKAISYAIDRRNIISNVLLNHAVAAEMPISPSFFAFDTKYNIYEKDEITAKKLLIESGYGTAGVGTGNVLNLTLIVPNKVGEEYRVEAAKEIVEQLAGIGIACTLEELTPEDYTARLQSGNYSLAYASYYLDQNMDISFLFQPDGPVNYGHISSTELMDAIAACNGAVTESEIADAYISLEKYFMEKVPQIGLYFRMNSIIADTSVTGITGSYENHVYTDIAAWSVVQNR